MSFPSSPTNGQLATVNNITYSYNSSLAAWTRATNLLANLTVNSLITGSGAFYPNGVPLATSYTSSTTAPGNANIKDQWYNPSTDVLYEYVTDGTSSYWVDYSSQGAGYTTTTQNIVTSVTPYSNNTINVGAVGSAFANLYISNIIAAGSTITVTGNIVPSANVTYSLGTPTARFSSLYLSGNTIDLGGAVMKTDTTTGAIALIPQPTTANPNPTGIVVSPTGAVSTVATTGGVPSATAIATSSNATATSGTTFANITVSGNAVIQGNLQVTGNITTVNYETVLYTETANVIIANSFIGNVHGAAAGANLSLQSNGTTNAVLDTSGRLGIGATPAINNNPLQVNYSAVGNNAFMYINNTDTSSNYSNAGVYFSSKNGASYGSIFADNANSALRLNFNSTNSVYIDSNGNFGVGVTPSAWSNFKAIQMTNGVGLASYTAGAVIMNLGANQYYNGSNYVYVNSDYSTSYQQTAGVHKWWVAPSGTAGATISLTQAMTLDNNGTLLIGTTSSRGGCYMTLSSSQWALGPSVGSPTLFFIAATNSTGVYLNGTSATSWSSNSDERLKTDLVPIANGLEKVNTLRAVTGRYKTDATGTSRAFLIAQDVQAVLPEAVGTIQIPESEDKTEYLSLAYQELIPLLVASIKELSAQVTALQSQVAALTPKE